MIEISLLELVGLSLTPIILIFALGKSFGWWRRDEKANNEVLIEAIKSNRIATEELNKNITSQHKEQTQAIVAPLEKVATALVVTNERLLEVKTAQLLSK